MTIPIYNELDMQKRFDGDERASDFSDLIDEVLEVNAFDDEMQNSLLLEVQERGTAHLTIKQLRILGSMFKEYDQHCGLCGSKIPISEMDMGGGNQFCNNH